MKATTYRQCLLVKKLSEGRLEQVSYIPEPFCVVGKILKLKAGNVWSDGWEVKSVGPSCDGEIVEKNSRAYTHFREVTDISRTEMKRKRAAAKEPRS